jgi:hypothetical protein
VPDRARQGQDAAESGTGMGGVGTESTYRTDRTLSYDGPPTVHNLGFRSAAGRYDVKPGESLTTERARGYLWPTQGTAEAASCSTAATTRAPAETPRSRRRRRPTHGRLQGDIAKLPSVIYAERMLGTDLPCVRMRQVYRLLNLSQVRPLPCSTARVPIFREPGCQGARGKL